MMNERIRLIICTLVCMSVLGACYRKVKTQLPPIKIETSKVDMLVDGKTISAEACQIDVASPIFKHRWFDQAIRAIKILPDGKILILDHETKLRRFRSQSSERCELAIDHSFGNNGVLELPKKGKYDTIALDSNGDIILSGFIVKPLKLSGNKIDTICDSFGRILIDPHTKQATQRRKLISLRDNCKKQPIKLEKWPHSRKVSYLRAWKDNYIATGSIKKLTKLALHEKNGAVKMMVGDKKGDTRICNVRTVEPCKFGLCLVDSNCRAMRIWTTDGRFVGKLSLYKLLGLTYPWVNALSVGRDVSYMAVSHKGLKNKKISVGAIYRIKGL